MNKEDIKNNINNITNWRLNIINNNSIIFLSRNITKEDINTNGYIEINNSMNSITIIDNNKTNFV